MSLFTPSPRRVYANNVGITVVAPPFKLPQFESGHQPTVIIRLELALCNCAITTTRPTITTTTTNNNNNKIVL